MASLRLNLVVIQAADLDVTARFYREVGVPLSQDQHGQGPVHYVAELGNVVFEIYPAKTTSPIDASTRLGFVVHDLDGMIDKLRGQSVSVSIEPTQSEWGRRSVVRDPDGRAVELYQENRTS